MLVDGPACRHCGCGGLLLWDWWQSALAAIKMGQRRSVALYDIFHETCMRSKFLYIFAIANTRKRKEIRGRQGHSGLHKWFRHGAAIGSASTVFLSMQSMMNPSTHLIAGSGSHLRPISQTVTNDPSILDECSNAGQSVRVKHNQQGSQVPAAQSREIDYIVHDVE
eukprot:gene3722-4071_t